MQVCAPRENPVNKPQVSVVTPVYNGEKYLDECIRSVLEQTYDNWVYVIVNNCSTDRSLEIAEKYAAIDPRIRVHSNKVFFSSLAESLNNSMRQIDFRSKYCKVVHADDWLYPECIEKMVGLAEEHPQAGIVGSYALQEKKVLWIGFPSTVAVVPGKAIGRATLLGELFVFGTPSSLLLRTELIEKRDKFYNEDNWHTDTDTCFDLLRNTDMGFVHQVLSFCRYHDKSETATFADRYNTYLLGALICLLKYGQSYLTEEEYRRRLRWNTNIYYAFLAKSHLRRKGKLFFEFHKREMKKIGYSITPAKLLRASLDVLIRQPKKAISAALGFDSRF